MQNVAIRTAKLSDAEAIASIYNHEVLHGDSTFDLVPRSITEQREWISARNGAFSVIVADKLQHGVVGFASLSTYRERAGYRTTVENSVYVRSDQQKLGIGRLLLTSLLDVARESGFHTMVARIEAQSEGSLALHSSLGFVFVGTEREVGRKHGRWLDSVIMQMMLTEF
jgi:L-amino acid N-acyltransferase YncA